MLACDICVHHYSDVIMSTIASQITGVSMVYSAVFSGADERKHQSSASLVLWGELTGDRWIPLTKGQWRGKCFHLMTSSWRRHNICKHDIAKNVPQLFTREDLSPLIRHRHFLHFWQLCKKSLTSNCCAQIVSFTIYFYFFSCLAYQGDMNKWG